VINKGFTPKVPYAAAEKLRHRIPPVRHRHRQGKINFSGSRFQPRPLGNPLQLILQFQPINPVIPGEAFFFCLSRGPERHLPSNHQNNSSWQRSHPANPASSPKFADQNCTVTSPGTLHFHVTSATSCESNVASRYGSQASQLLGNLLSQRHLSNTFCTWD
jgi:hypothetical protein